MRRLGREVDALVAPLQQRKLAELHAQFSAVCEQVRHLQLVRCLHMVVLLICWMRLRPARCVAAAAS